MVTSTEGFITCSKMSLDLKEVRERTGANSTHDDKCGSASRINDLFLSGHIEKEWAAFYSSASEHLAPMTFMHMLPCNHVLINLRLANGPDNDVHHIRRQPRSWHSGV